MFCLFALLARRSRRFAEHLEATRSIEIALTADQQTLDIECLPP